MSKKASQGQDGVYVLRKTKRLGDIKGIAGKPRSMLRGKDEEGRDIIEDRGEYTGYKFPSSIEDIVPKFDPILKVWPFEGDDEQLQEIVDALELRYPRKHPDAGKQITKANRRNPNDAFFDHPTWTENPEIMEGSSKVLNTNDPRQRFLMLCTVGNRFTEGDEENDNPLTAVGIKYKMIKSTADDAKTIKSAQTEMELISALFEMPHEKARDISIIMGLVFSLESDYNVDRIKPNLLETLKKTSTDTGDRRIFEGKSPQAFFGELSKDKAGVLTKKVNIRLGINKNILRFKDGNYQLKGDSLYGVTKFSELVNYFSDSTNAEQYNILLEALEA